MNNIYAIYQIRDSITLFDVDHENFTIICTIQKAAFFLFN